MPTTVIRTIEICTSGAPALVVVWKRLFQLREHRRQIGRRLFDRHGGRQAGDREQEETAALLVPREVRLHDAVHRLGHPHRRSAAEQRAAEPPRRHADHRERRAVERQRLADDCRIPAQAALPEPMAENYHRRRLLAFLGQEPAAECRPCAKDGEIVARHHLRRDLLRLGAAAPVDLREGKRRHPGEHLVLVANVLVVEMGEGESARIALIDHEHRHQPIRLGDRHRLEHDRVDHAEDGGIGADAERQRQRGDGSEGGTLREHAKAVTEILEHGLIMERPTTDRRQPWSAPVASRPCSARNRLRSSARS
jgi:hypothetical protein